MLTVPGGAFVPFAGHFCAGVVRGDLTGVTLLAVGVAVQVSGPVVGRDRGLLGSQHAVDRLTKRTAVDVACAGGGCSAQRGEGIIAVAAGVIIRCVGGQEGRGRAALAPVVDVAAAGHIVDFFGAAGTGGRGAAHRDGLIAVLRGAIRAGKGRTYLRCAACHTHDCADLACRLNGSDAALGIGPHGNCAGNCHAVRIQGCGEVSRSADLNLRRVCSQADRIGHRGGRSSIAGGVAGSSGAAGTGSCNR